MTASTTKEIETIRVAKKVTIKVLVTGTKAYIAAFEAAWRP